MKDKFELKKILVSLDLSEMDEMLIRISAYAARMMQSDRVYFVHIAQDLNMPKELRKKWGNLLAPVDENLQHMLEQQVAEFFEAPPGCEVLTEVHEGNATDRLLKLARQKDVDLLVLGIKDKLAGSGALPDKAVKASPRSVLLVPEVLPDRMDKILVPVDFSAHSLQALRQALFIQQNSPIPLEVKCQHVYHLPTGWHKTGKAKRSLPILCASTPAKTIRNSCTSCPNSIRTFPVCLPWIIIMIRLKKSTTGP
ncbi:Universal stress protein family protein [Cesiribacter andamanensis AMV16]|uniref:Universal stress protein family protein n=1 Tax=Cesiribacter andamanensis AMV16 TaxID=1279009 RepID=M7NJT7_9BACT|nr:Universal stress protein family protein [Cesiribacter andamanensis AMV16]